MNHFRELTDQLLDAETSRSRQDLTEQAAQNTVCFYCGAVSDYAQLKDIPELLRLPFIGCWFEFMRPNGDIYGVKAGQHSTTRRCHFLFYARQRVTKRWVYEGGFGTEPDLETVLFSDKSTLENAELRQRLQVVRAFLSALNCSNVRRQQHAPDTKLQKARARRGKALLFSYWTLQLTGKSERGDDQGGTHAGPRVHLRRGHPRQYAPGNWTWVQAHAVGNRANGMVHKDYSAGPAMVAAAR